MAYQPIAVEADPKAGVGAVLVAEKRIADEPEERQDCIDCGLLGCSSKIEKAVIGARTAAGSSLVVGVDCSRLKAGCMIAAVTCTAGLEL